MLVISEFLVALLISLFVVQFLKLKWACSRLPPGPTPLPLIGTIWQMDFKRQHEILMKLAQIYGNIFTLWIGHIPVIILNGFTAVKGGLTVHSEDISGRPATPFFQKMAGGKGIIFTSGHTWKQQRRFGLMTLRNLGLGKKGLEHRIQEEARQLLEYFMNERGDPLDPSFPIVNSVSNVIAAVVFGHRFSIEDKDFHQLIENNDYMVKQGSSISELLYDVFPWLMDHLPGTHQKVFYCHEFLRSFARKEVRSHQERGSPDEPQDFIDFYLAQIDKSKADPYSTFDEDNLVQTIFELFLAGTETTTTTMRWAVLNMVAYPDIQGIIFTSGHTWKQQRRFGLMTLRNLGLGKKGLEHRIQEEARQLLEYFMNERGDPLDPSFPIVHSVSNVIAAVVFGHRFSIEDKDFHQLIENNNYLTKQGSSISELLYDIFSWLMDHLPGTHQKIFHCHEFLRSFARKEVRSHQERGSPDEPQDFIDFYLAQIDKSKADPHSTFDEDNLVQTIFELFFAGTETTATTMRWAVLNMVAYPDIQERVQKELDAVLGPSQLICYEDRKNLPYSYAVIHEIQRHSSIIAVGIPRECVKDTVLQGFPVEKGTIILPNLISALLDPEHWETPRQFNPNHFLDQDGNFVNKEAFLAFSAGHRVCLGEQLARTELFIFFTNLLRAFTFRLPEGVKEINTESMLGGFLQPHPYKICAVPR
ncbi:hypothetical protein KIL84_022545 [Mauremys mutica]|uniref:Cytochrome P450 n=1 Tax=Mauremys mutica TaxID=74926 RepID=A0A9D4AQQ3_9SAUR|nr:hypothetical protein KIL84_022545 [Mauremys mutica]